MRLGLISDIHANEVALEAVLKDIKQFGVDQIICLGDVATLGPQPCSVIQILQDIECDCILGNHDEFMINPELVHVYTDIPIIVEAITWCRKQLSDSDLDFIRTFKKCIEISPDVLSKLLLFHGSPNNHMKDIFSTTPSDELDSMLSGYTATVMA
jgi:predicted phosphodiesterase